MIPMSACQDEFNILISWIIENTLVNAKDIGWSITSRVPTYTLLSNFTTQTIRSAGGKAFKLTLESLRVTLSVCPTLNA